MNRTLGYTVQRVLEKLDLDSVNSIGDSQDAILIAREAETTFYDMMSRNDWPEREDIIELDSVSDILNPTKLRLPSNVLSMKSLRYNIAPYSSLIEDNVVIKKVTVEEFIRRSENLKAGADNVTLTTYNGVELRVLNDRAPEVYTSFDNEHVILDAFNSSTESTLQGSKTTALVSIVPEFTIDDEFIIPLDVVSYPLFLAELTAAMSVYLNGTQSVEDERRRNRGIGRLRRKAHRTEVGSLNNCYGRNGNGRS